MHAFCTMMTKIMHRIKRNLNILCASIAALSLVYDDVVLLVNGSTLIVGNTRDNEFPAYRIDPVGFGVQPFITAADTDSVLENPDFFKVYNGLLYVSSGDTIETSAIARFTLAGSFVDIIASGNGMKRPYGFDIYEDVLYVASFRSDQVLKFSATDGTFMGVFAQGNQTREGLCNGPNHVAISDGKLYMTTQGSIITPEGELKYPGFPSEVVVYDIETGNGKVFIDQPEVLPGSLGFISMLGLLIECEGDDCYYYTTDFGGGLRAYKTIKGGAPTLEYVANTTYTPGAATGGLAIDNDKGNIYVVSATTPGAVLSFKKADGTSLNGANGVLLQSDKLFRPIGALFISTCSVVDFTYLDGTTAFGSLSTNTIDYSIRSADIKLVAAVDLCPGGGNPTSVRLTLDQPNRTECQEISKYVLPLRSALMPLGTRTITATPYSGKKCTGETGNPLTQIFEVEGCDVTLNLYSGQTNKKITTIQEGKQYKPPCEVNIEASLKCGFKIRTVILEIHRGGRLVHRREDRRAPYFLYGSFLFNVYSGKLGIGSYSMFVTINGIVHPATNFKLGACV